MNGLKITLLLEEPVLATGIEGDPNSSVSLAYIPGGQIRGAVVGAYLQRQERGELDLESADDRRLFLDGQTRFLNANPAIEVNDDAVRLLPTPLGFRVKKGQSDPIYDLAVEVPNFPQTSPVRPRFLHLEGGTAYGYNERVQVNVHTQRDAIFGRPVEGSGAVFQYQALPAGLRLVALILSETEMDLDLLEGLLKGKRLLLGGSRSAGYGTAWVEEISRLEENERELAGELNQDETYSHIMVRCLSSVLVRDGLGQYTLDILPALSTSLKVGAQYEQRRSQPLVFARAQLVGSFNRKWGLPTPQAAAIAAGSVFVVQFDPPVAGSDLLKLEASGLGERRAEGFGRIAFLDYDAQPAEYRIEEADDERQAPTEAEVEAALGQMGEENHRLADVVLQRLVYSRLEQQLRSTVAAIGIAPGARPSNHAISRWRSAAQLGIASKSMEPVRRLLQAEENKDSPTWRSFQRTRLNLGGQLERLSDWMRKIIDPATSPWTMLGEPPAIGLGPVDRRITAAIGDDESLEFRLRLLDGMLAKLSKLPGGSNNG